MARAYKEIQNLENDGVSYFLTPEWGSSTEGPSRLGADAERRLQNEGKSVLRIRMKIVIALGLASLFFEGVAYLPAQGKPSAGLPPAEKLNEQEMRGEGLFLQRCSLCHLPRKLKFGSPPVIGPILTGQFKDAAPDQLKILRGFILKGGPDMPGFQYGLEPKEVDDLIVFLKTL